MRTEEGEVSPRPQPTRRRTAATVFLITVAMLLAYLCYQIIWPFLGAIAWAMILAILFEPAHRRLHHLLKHDGVSAFLSTTITLLVAVVPIVLLGLAIAREAAQAYRQITASLNDGNGLVTVLAQIPFAGSLWQRLQTFSSQWGIDLNAVLSDMLRRVGEFTFGVAKGTITNVTAFLLNVVLIAFTLFYFFRDGKAILARLQYLLPIRPQTAVQVFTLIAEVIRAAAGGIFLLALIKGVLAGLAFWVVGIHSPVLWGTASAFASLIPVVGVALVWAPAAVALWLQGSLLKAILLAIWGLTALSLIDNILYPILVGSQVRLHTLLVFFSALGGLTVFGFLGFALGPVIASLTVMLIERASQHYWGRTPMEAEASEAAE